MESLVNLNSTDIQHNEVNKANVQVTSDVSHGSISRVALNVGSEKLDALMDRLSTTHAQLDSYTQRRTHQISVETQHIIEKILEETKEKQRDLLVEAQQRSQLFQEEYQHNLQTKINHLNEDKAQQLAQLEKSLNFQQEQILLAAREQIDRLQQQANQMKMHVLQDAQEKTNARLEQITDQVVLIGQEDSAQRLATSTTTVITTQAIAANQQTYAQAVSQQ